MTLPRRSKGGNECTICSPNFIGEIYPEESESRKSRKEFSDQLSTNKSGILDEYLERLQKYETTKFNKRPSRSSKSSSAADCKDDAVSGSDCDVGEALAEDAEGEFAVNGQDVSRRKYSTCLAVFWPKKVILSKLKFKVPRRKECKFRGKIGMLLDTDVYRVIPCGCTMIYEDEMKEVIKISSLFDACRKVRVGQGTAVLKAAKKQLTLISTAAVGASKDGELKAIKLSTEATGSNEFFDSIWGDCSELVTFDDSDDDSEGEGTIRRKSKAVVRSAAGEDESTSAATSSASTALKRRRVPNGGGDDRALKKSRGASGDARTYRKLLFDATEMLNTYFGNGLGEISRLYFPSCLPRPRRRLTRIIWRPFWNAMEVPTCATGFLLSLMRRRSCVH